MLARSSLLIRPLWQQYQLHIFSAMVTAQNRDSWPIRKGTRGYADHEYVSDGESRSRRGFRDETRRSPPRNGYGQSQKWQQQRPGDDRRNDRRGPPASSSRYGQKPQQRDPDTPRDYAFRKDDSIEEEGDHDPRRPTMAANVTRGSRADTVIPYVKPPKDLAWSTHARTKVVSEAVRLAFGFTKCTPEQATIRTALVDRRHDALVQAKTGTGKTLAYLTAALDAVLNRSIASEAKSAIPVLIVVPTRELAEQVFVEGKKLVDEIPGVTMALMTSGGSEKFQEKLISDRKEGQKILVGTPGRILAATKWLPNGQPGILGNSRLFWVHTLIIDEADRMLDPMFQTQVFEILKHMPSHPRVVRTQLFSATYKPELIQFAKSVLRPGFTAVSTIPATDPGTVHSTRHLYAVAPMAAHPALLHALLVRGHREVHERSLGMVGLKVMVFLPTVRMTELYHALFLRIHESDPEGDLPPPYQLHASLSSSARDANARGFRNATRGVLFTSDVSARGVHYPGVQIVVQIGAPASREAYVHRVGRTGRGTDATAAAPGSDVAHGGSVGLLLLSPAERAAVLEMLALDLPLVRADNVNGCIDQLGVGDSVPWNGSKSAREVKHAVSKEAAGLNQKQGLLQDAYLATLGHYENLVPMLERTSTSPYAIVRELNEFTTSLGLQSLPALPAALRETFGTPHSSMLDRRALHEIKAGAVGDRGKMARIEKQRKNAVGTFTKTKRAALDNEFMYQPDRHRA